MTQRDEVFGRISRLRPRTVEHLPEVEVDGRVFLDVLRCSEIRSNVGRATLTARPLRDALDDLVEIADAEGAADFVRCVGIPDLCSHGRPMAHVRADLDEGPSTFCPAIRDDDGAILLPLRHLLTLGGVVASVRHVSADLAVGRAVKDASRLAAARQWSRVGPIGKTLAVQRRDFGRVCEGLLRAAGVEAAVRWNGELPELTYRVDGLTAGLLMLAVTDAVVTGRDPDTVGVTTCEGCGRLIPRGHRSADAPAYCGLPECRRTAASERQRRRRARVQTNEGDNDGER